MIEVATNLQKLTTYKKECVPFVIFLILPTIVSNYRFKDFDVFVSFVFVKSVETIFWRHSKNVFGAVSRFVDFAVSLGTGALNRKLQNQQNGR